MITELDTDEELSQTSNLTQDDDLTFELTSGPLTNNTQTQPSTILHKDNTTQEAQHNNTKRNKRLSVSQHTSTETVRTPTKSSKIQLTSSQHPNKKRPKLQTLNTQTISKQGPSNTTAITSPISTTTISDNPDNTKLTYSQITQKQLNIPQFNSIDDSEWADIIQSKITDQIDTPFDQQIWSYEKITEALQTPTGIHDFINHKLMTILTEFIIPPAIFLKFKIGRAHV